MSNLTLDKSDPNIAELVSDWQDGQQYVIELVVTQTSSDDKQAVFSVDEITEGEPYSEEMEPEEEEMPMKGPPKGGMPKAVVAVMIGKKK